MALARTGISSNRNSFQAGREAALQALDLGEPAGLVLVHATGGHDHRELLRGVASVTGTIPVSGCSTSAVISNEGLDESTHVCGAVAFRQRGLEFRTFQETDFSRSAKDCARRLVASIRNSGVQKPKLLLLFPDGQTGNVADLLATLKSGLPRDISIAGGTAGELLRLGRSSQYHGSEPSSDSVSAVLIGGALRVVISASHGCEPIGLEQTVTKAENGWIYEIDGKPAWSVYRDYLDPKDQDIENLSMSHICYICLAEMLPKAHPDYGPYIIRCPLQLDRRTEALFFPGNIVTGTKVRMALRNIERTLANGKAAAQRLRELSSEPPALILHFDCCCRGRLLFGKCARDAALGPMQAVFRNEVPWYGFGTYGEIAPLGDGETLFHNYSTILCALYEENGGSSGGHA